MERQSINPEAKGFRNDRATVIIKGHYQEFETTQATSVSHAYDFTNHEAAVAFQTIQKINPSAPVELNIGPNEWGKCMLILSHDPVKVGKDAPEALKNTMASNKIILTNADGVVVGILRHRRASVVEYPFPVFAQAESTTALLSITVYPVTE
jgi:hypothetical protein